MILIFDTYSGLCNQMMDINTSINFCIFHKIKFSFRYCSFRDKNQLHIFNEMPFNLLFDINKIIEEFNLKDFYIDYNLIKLKINKLNTFENNKRAIHFLNKDNCIYQQLKNLNKEYIIVKQFWPIYNLNINNNTIIYLNPNNKLLQIYKEIIKKFPKEYNAIHYRYELDFKNHFKCEIKDLNSILKHNNFKNQSLKIYIATSNIYECIDNNTKNFNIFYKDDNKQLLNNLNFEEKAYIDYLICTNSTEFFGNNKSSFSQTINNIKKTNNYY